MIEELCHEDYRNLDGASGYRHKREYEVISSVISNRGSQEFLIHLENRLCSRSKGESVIGIGRKASVEDIAEYRGFQMALKALGIFNAVHSIATYDYFPDVSDFDFEELNEHFSGKRRLAIPPEVEAELVRLRTRCDLDGKS